MNTCTLMRAFHEKTIHFRNKSHSTRSDGLPPLRGAGVTLGVELRSTADLSPSRVSEAEKEFDVFWFCGYPAKSKPCQKYHRLADSVARFLPDSHKISDCLWRTLGRPC
ncbi:unnamed protein product [Strongylus vulgaris]|uniref:Uncharacterized protein n=1 Tax=Strongylus vulgaris TaxID=40348 RepID=A0A3P7J619_STRVU|nr:unnamed protein product [Strongylus vulgaris]